MEGLSKTFEGNVRALAGVDLAIERGETLGLVGESGSGKTTLARVLLGLIPPDAGSTVTLHGKPLSPDARRRPREILRALQIVFQNPDSALNRRHSVRGLISRPLTQLAGLSGHGAAGPAGGADRLGAAGGPAPAAAPEPAFRRAQAAGRDRACLRAGPEVVVCDEPTSALDVSVQAAILNLLADLQKTSAPPICSSPTTWAWSGTCRTASWCCTSGG